MNFPFEHLFARKYKLPAHILFWLMVLLFYTLFYGHQRGEYYKTFFYVCLLLPVTISITYLINYLLVPKYLLQKRYEYFFLFFAYTFLFSVWLESIIFLLAFISIAQHKVSNLNPATFDIFFLIVSMYLVVFLALAIKLFKQWYAIGQANQLLAHARLEAELRLKEAELNLLKAQIQPHFLFNTLNNLYGLTLEKSDAAPEVVLKIASILDYLLYQCNSPKVALEQEIKHIYNFIALEKLRYNEQQLHMRFTVKGKIKGKLIAPMLILPFVENSFKHGVSRQISNSTIQIDLVMEGNRMQLRVENTKGDFPAKGLQSNKEGIGLQNVRKRLELLYKDTYQLLIEEKERQYIVRLDLHLEEKNENHLYHSR